MSHLCVLTEQQPFKHYASRCYEIKIQCWKTLGITLDMKSSHLPWRTSETIEDNFNATVKYEINGKTT